MLTRNTSEICTGKGLATAEVAVTFPAQCGEPLSAFEPGDWVSATPITNLSLMPDALRIVSSWGLLMLNGEKIPDIVSSTTPYFRIPEGTVITIVKK